MVVIVSVLLASASAAQPISSPPAIASSSATQPSDAAVLAFVKAFSPSNLRRDNELRILQTQFVSGLKKDPGTAALLETYPTLGSAMTDALAQHIDIYIEEYDARFFPRASAIAKANLTTQDLEVLTGFYSSELGQRSLRLASNNLDASEISAAGLKGEAVTPEMTTRQVMRSGIAAFTELSINDRKQVVAIAMSPAGRRFRSIMPEIVALQTELSNNPGPVFTARSEKSLAEAFKRVTGINPTAK